MINIDFLVAGCNTHCKHCYVNGGPGPMMLLEDTLLCIERLDGLASYLPGEVSFTLDHEPMNHPNIDRILRAASQTRNITNYHHGMTSGVGLIHRKDKEAVIGSYLACGYDTFGITLHGAEKHHDEITRREGACHAAIAAAKFIKAQGAHLDVSLMLNHFFAEDAESVSTILKQLEPDYIHFAIPIFTPHRNMMDFEPYRASVKTLEDLRGYLSEWRQDETEVRNRAERSTPIFVYEQLYREETLRELFRQKQDELYLSLHQDCKLYVGNSGAETRCLGDLRSMDLKAAAETIRALPGNRDYGAFYDEDALPATEKLRAALEQLPQENLYGDFPSVVYRGLVELKEPTKIIALQSVKET